MTTKLLENALKSVGGVEEYKRIRKQFSEDLAFITDNREKLLEDYNKKWVAVYESKVVAYGRGYNNILSQLEKNDLPVEQIPIRFLSKQKVFALYLW